MDNIQDLIYRVYTKETHECTFETVKYETPPNIHIIECTICGKESLAWSWDSLEDQK